MMADVHPQLLNVSIQGVAGVFQGMRCRGHGDDAEGRGRGWRAWGGDFAGVGSVWRIGRPALARAGDVAEHQGDDFPSQGDHFVRRGDIPAVLSACPPGDGIASPQRRGMPPARAAAFARSVGAFFRPWQVSPAGAGIAPRQAFSIPLALGDSPRAAAFHPVPSVIHPVAAFAPPPP